jgi:hypothetical protein
MPDGYVAEAESAAGGYQRTACANLFDDLLVALRLRLIPLSGLARRLDTGLVADEPNQTWRQSEVTTDGYKRGASLHTLDDREVAFGAPFGAL